MNAANCLELLETPEIASDKMTDGTVSAREMEESDRRLQRVAQAARAYLDQHGHAFQYAVIERAERLLGEEPSSWVFQVAEFPVSVNGNALHIDFVLRHRDRNVFLIGECKRANPKFSDWCFVRAPHVSSSSSGFGIVLESVGVPETAKQYAPGTSVRTTFLSKDVYHLAFEIKSNAKGDGQGIGRGDLDAAIAQVFRGVNGIIEQFLTQKNMLSRGDSWTLVPVIVTTARLWSVVTKLADSNLFDGTIPEELKLQERSFVVLNYPVSPALRHNVERHLEPPTLSKLLEEEYLKSVFIVNAHGLDEFLVWSSNFLRV